jgi:hypothetical protein
MQRYDNTRVELHPSEQKFVHTMTGTWIDRVLRPEQLHQHWETLRQHWRHRNDGVAELTLLFIKDMYDESVRLIHPERLQ